MKLKYSSKETWICGKKEGSSAEKQRSRRKRVDDGKKDSTTEGREREKKTKRREGVCFTGEEFDRVRSRHSTREGGGTSARWRWRVACLARAGAAYDKAD